MSSPCEQKEIIQDILAIVGALKELPAAIKDMRLDLREMMKEMQTSVADSREYRTLIAQNRRDIENLSKTDHEQWEALELQAKRIDEHSARVGARLEALEKWQAGLNGGRIDGLATRLDALITDQEHRKGRAALFAAVPIIISLGAFLIALLTYLHNSIPTP